MTTILAVDVGGTKLAAGVADEDGRLAAEASAPTPRTNDPEELFAALVSLCGAVLKGGRVNAIGAGCGGPMRWPEGVVSPLHIRAWREFPLRDRLERHFGIPAVVDNDAKAMSLGEWWRGAGRGSRAMLGMVVSTGVGGGLVVGGRLIDGAHGHAGHIGHVLVWPDGPTCACGAQGCVTAVASGSGITARVADAHERGVATSLAPGATARDAAEHARAGDTFARSLLVDAGQALGRAIASATALVDLDLVVIGGGIALGAWDLIGPPLEEELGRRSRVAFARGLRVARAALGERAGLVGAARLALGR